ncbi:MAG: helix-turn-helix domain-containing protein [Pseudonocardiaceae bacterium]
MTGTPERLNLAALVALCDILGCRAEDLIEPVAPAGKNARTPGAPPARGGRGPAAPGYCP